MPRRLARPLIAVLVLAWLALEVWLYYLVGSSLGTFGAVLLLAVGVVLGTAAAKNAGRRAMRSLQETAERMQAAGGDPAAVPGKGGKAVRGGDTALAVLGGVLLAVPTFATDVLGLLFLFPPTRALLRHGFAGLFAGRLMARTPFGRAMADARSMGTQFRVHQPGSTVVPGEVVPDGDEAQDGGAPASRPGGGTGTSAPRVIEGTVVEPGEGPSDGSTTGRGGAGA